VLWVPLAVSLIVAALLAPPILAELRGRALVRVNYRGAEVPTPAGVLIPLAAIVAFGPIVLVSFLLRGEALFADFTGFAFFYVLGVAFLGLLDDLLGSGRTPEDDAELPRGWRGHARAAAGGRTSTGAIKAVGTLALALVTVAAFSGVDLGAYVVGVLLLVLTTNLFNLLDLRPGRSIKVLVLLGAGLVIAYPDYLDPFWGLGIFLAPILVLLPYDLRERGMLGDTGSNVIGAVAGLWMVSTMTFPAQLVALAVVLVITLYGEFRSISALIEKTPGLRQLDSLGRAHA
jgi:hypothetical protein